MTEERFVGEEKHLESLGILSFANLTATYLFNNAIVCARELQVAGTGKCAA